MLRSVEHICRQRESYNGAARRTIGDPGSAAVCPYNCIHESKPQSMPERVFPLTKRSNARALISGGNPGPLSSITSSADLSCDRTRIVIWHPSGK